MTDMMAVIVPKSDQWNADDFIAGPLTFTVAGVQIRAGEEQPVSIQLEGTPKVYRPCKSMSRVLVSAWGADAKAYAGRSLTLYRDPTVKWGGMAVGGIRISHMSHIDRDLTMMLTESKANRKPHKVKVLEVAPPPASVDPAVALDSAKDAARNGKDAFTAWWKANPDMRDAVKPHMEALQAICAEADAAKPEPERDVFGLPPLPKDNAE